MEGGAGWAAVHGVAESRTRLRDFTFTFLLQALEKEMATHSSVLAWRIPGTGEPGGLPSVGSHRVRHDWSDLAAAAAAVYYRLKYNSVLIVYQLWWLNCLSSSFYVHWPWQIIGKHLYRWIENVNLNVSTVSVLVISTSWVRINTLLIFEEEKQVS